VVAWRGGGRWLTYIWSIDKWVVENSTALFTKGTGNQGGEGTDHGQEWYIENVLEELDSEREWYYDHRAGLLYFAFNGTAPTTEEWIATRTKVLFNVSGTAAAPAKGITINGVQIRDTALTWLDPHGLPSGGDWALQRSGAITLEGTEDFTVSNSLFEKIDGNGVMLNGYNRNATVVGNEFAWVGATCVASWGYSSTCFNGNCSYKLPWREGPDARGGEQPRGTRVLNNLFRESAYDSEPRNRSLGPRNILYVKSEPRKIRIAFSDFSVSDSDFSASDSDFSTSDSVSPISARRTPALFIIELHVAGISPLEITIPNL
jgi:hypothetical protein